MKTGLAAAIAAVVLAAGCREPLSVPINRAQGGSPDIPGNPSVAGIHVSGAAIANQPLVFSNTGSFDHENYTRSWTFSDGGSAEGQTVFHTFTSDGFHTVSLVASDTSASDLEGTIAARHYSLTIQVLAAAPDTTTRLPDQVRRR